MARNGPVYLIFFIYTQALVCAAETPIGENSGSSPLFAETSALEFTLEAPFSTLIHERKNEPEVPAVLRYRQADGTSVVVNVALKPRGISRLRHCRFPPLRLNFNVSEVAGTVFAGQDKLKLVTHCMERNSYRDYVAREYQVYRAYNLVTDYSLRVRWVRINYSDSESSGASIIEPGFLIEAENAAAERLGMDVLEVEALTVAELDRRESTVMALFQFMIGNVDWSALRGASGDHCCHNFKVLAPRDQAAGRVLLPYDFDQSAFVDAAYAVHNEAQGLRRNERRYKGFCALNDELGAANGRLQSIREAWLQLLADGPVSKRAQRRGVRYIEAGYDIVTNPARMARAISNRCRQQ